MTYGMLGGLALGSLAGGFARFALAGSIQRAAGAAWPWGILTVNLLGCLLVGFIDGLAGRLSAEARLALAAGFCGAFTTFSALMLDASRLARGGAAGRAFAYVTFSAAAGFLCVRLGARLAARF